MTESYTAEQIVALESSQDATNSRAAEAMTELNRRQWIKDCRIEALRAASRIVASIERPTIDTATGYQVTPSNATLAIAEQFSKWLETGER